MPDNHTPAPRPSPFARHGNQVLSRAPQTLKFSLAHLTLLEREPAELTEIAARAGYDFVSFRPIAFGTPNEPLYPLATDRSMFKRARSALAATGLQLLDIELARLCRETPVKSYLPALETAAQLGARHVLSSAWCDDRAYVLDQLIELCELAKPLGLTVDFESMPFSDVKTLVQAASLVRDSHCENAGVCIDTLHFDRGGCHVADIEPLPQSWFHYAQISDGPQPYSTQTDDLKHVAREARLYLGEGGIDVRAILSRLPPIPYSIELPNAQRLAQLGPDEFARRCLVSAKRYLHAPCADTTDYAHPNTLQC